MSFRARERDILLHFLWNKQALPNVMHDRRADLLPIYESIIKFVTCQKKAVIICMGMLFTKKKTILHSSTWFNSFVERNAKSVRQTYTLRCDIIPPLISETYVRGSVRSMRTQLGRLLPTPPVGWPFINL